MIIANLILTIISTIVLLFCGKFRMSWKAQNNIRLISTIILTVTMIDLLQNPLGLSWLLSLCIAVAFITLLYFITKWLRLYNYNPQNEMFQVYKTKRIIL